MNAIAERLMTLIQLAPAWCDAQRSRVEAKIEELKRREAEAKAAREPQANGKAHAPEPEVFLTDTGNATRFARQHKDVARFCAPWGAWLTWDDSHWQEDTRRAVDQLAKATIRRIIAEARGQGEAATALMQKRELTDDTAHDDATDKKMSKSQKLFQHAIKCESAPRIAAMLRLAQGELAVVPGQLDGDPYLFNVLNGTIELRTGIFRPHRREDYITKVAPITYDASAGCPQWERALRSIFPESPVTDDAPGDTEIIGFVQRLLGMCLSGDTSEQVLTIFHGDGSNGKSSILETVCAVLGPYAGPAPEGLLLVRRGEQHPTELADLFSMRLIHSTETGEGARLDEARVKKLTGGDTIKARYMKQNFFSFTPTHKLLVCTNHRPKIRGTDFAIWRRVLLVPFRATFWDAAKPARPGEQRLDRFRKDKELIKDKFEHERPGILNWLLAGFREWQRRGLCPPAGVQAAVEEYQRSEDLIGQFVEERCRLFNSRDVKAKSGELYGAFLKWAGESGERSYTSQRAFSQRIIQLTGFDSSKVNGTRWLPGVALLSEEKTDEPQLDLPD